MVCPDVPGISRSSRPLGRIQDPVTRTARLPPHRATPAPAVGPCVTTVTFCSSSRWPTYRKSTLLRVEGGFETTREVLGLALRPVVQKHDARLLMCHVVVDRDDVDVRTAQRLENILKLVLEHREVAIDDGRLLASSERRPGVHAHGLPDLRPVHRRPAAKGELGDAVLHLGGSSKDRLERLGVDRALRWDAHPSKAGFTWRRIRIRCVQNLPDPDSKLLAGPHAADVHEE